MNVVEKQYHIQPKNTFSKPTTLLHFTNNLQNALNNGFDTQARWIDVNEFIPARPIGSFWFNAEKPGFAMGAYEVLVDVADLDKSKLFAFPSSLAETANQLVIRGKGVTTPEILEWLKNAGGVAYEDFTGEFEPEWIYTENIASLLVRPGKDY